MQRLRSKPSAKFETLSYPLLLEIVNVPCATEFSVQTHVIFGLQLHAESYNSFVRVSQKDKQSNCRIQSIMFAQSVKSSLRRLGNLWALRKCVCSGCNGGLMVTELQKLEKDLASIVKKKSFNLYNQSPWVAGSLMLGMLHQGAVLGMVLCSRRYYVAALLHMYKLLRRLGVVDKEAMLLENLCTALFQSVFKGQHPQQNLVTQFAFFAGGRLQFNKKKGRKRTYTDEKQPCNGPERA